MQHTLLKGDFSNAFFFSRFRSKLANVWDTKLNAALSHATMNKTKRTSVKVVEMTHALWRNGSIWVLSNSKNAEIMTGWTIPLVCAAAELKGNQRAEVCEITLTTDKHEYGDWKWSEPGKRPGGKHMNYVLHALLVFLNFKQDAVTSAMALRGVCVSAGAEWIRQLYGNRGWGRVLLHPRPLTP